VSQSENDKIKAEMQPVIEELERQGVSFNVKETEYVGLGDVVESTLQTFGITEERFKSWFNLKECNCAKRKKWLNNLFSWRKQKKEG
jgi:G:T-mismatch repair DNA endonuclease (very short patch repair protein)